MSGWNNRIVRRCYINPLTGHEEVTFSVHEAYYDDNGAVSALTKDSIAPQGEMLKELKGEIHRFLDAFEKPILDYDTLDVWDEE